MKLIVLFCCVVCFCQPVYAGAIVAVPDPVVAGVPTTATRTSECVGVSDVGAAVCNWVYFWKSGTGRFKQNNYRNVSALYYTRTLVTLKPLTGDTGTRVYGITPGGKPWGQSFDRFYSSKIVIWDALGSPTSYGPGTPVDVDDLGRIAAGAAIYDPATAAWATIPDAYAITALSSNGDAVGVFVAVDPDGIEHANLYRLSEYGGQADIEDACSFPCLAGLFDVPTKTRMNGAGVVVWHFAFATGGPVGLRAIPGDPELFVAYVALSAINSAGDAVGSNQIVRMDGTIEALPLGMQALGINDPGVVVGAGLIGGVRRGWVR